MLRSHGTKIKERVSKDQLVGAQRDLLEQLYDDHYKNRWRIYKVNFTRGIFFGFGSILGATILVSLTLWALSFFVKLPDAIVNQIESAQSRKVSH